MEDRDADELAGVHQKWGFGMAPVKAPLQQLRVDACKIVEGLILSESMPESSLQNLEAVSTVKGMFNRVLREDQWDWFTVATQLGFPGRLLSMKIANQLADLRAAIKRADYASFGVARRELYRLPTLTCLHAYLGMLEIREEPNSGWIYVLSTREIPKLLKVGMTTRTVEQRVQEINRATGVAIPFGVRKCWRVREPQQVEKTVHGALSDFRFRNDREFFQLEFEIAVKKITKILADNDFEIRTLNALGSLGGSS